MSYLVFDTEDDADTANDTISSNMGCPVVGDNAATGLPDPDAQQTIQWAVPVQTDANASTYPSSWVFPTPSDPSLLNGVSGGGGLAGNKGRGGKGDDSNDGPTQADYDPTWFPPSDTP